MKRAIWILFFGLSVACGDRFSALTVPPPGATAELDVVKKTVELSKGASIAIECRSNSGPCEALTVEANDPSLVDVRGAVLDELGYSYSGRRKRSALVITGLNTGTTMVEIKTESAESELEVIVRPL